MSDVKILKDAWELYQEAMRERNNDDYVVDACQMEKLMRAYEFFCRVAVNCGGTIEPLHLEPKEENGGVSVHLALLYLDGENLGRFQKIVGDMGAISIDATLDGNVCISFTIPGVFRHKS